MFMLESKMLRIVACPDKLIWLEKQTLEHCCDQGTLVVTGDKIKHIFNW